jgi:hypothetical protein
MNDTFVGYVEAGTAAWGRPRISRKTEREVATWNTANGCEFQIANRYAGIALYIHSPQFTRVLNSI